MIDEEARRRFENGNVEKAISCQQAALRPGAKSPEEKRAYEERLRRYQSLRKP